VPSRRSKERSADSFVVNSEAVARVIAPSPSAKSLYSPSAERASGCHSAQD
jgi:hypothetical protein